MIQERVREALEALRVPADEQTLEKLVLHAGMMLAANEVQNLTRIVAEREVAFLHVADSLTALPYLLGAPEGPFADLGSGAGYPGIPLAILSARPATLVESRSKKAAFLEEVVTVLGVAAEVCGCRAEELAENRASSFSAVTARALAPLPSLVELAAPLLTPGGVLIAMKGEPAEEEVAAGDDAGRIVGLERISTDGFLLPEANVRRTILCFSRTGDSQVRLPRRPGMAQRRPLA